MSEQDKIDNRKSDLVADLLATQTVMDEVWRYHPDNPNKKDIIKEYKILEKIKSDIEKELAELEK
jgi:hypothetical protein|tara:strand:- start:187 stop:381 length:195 start_codon:yes stop_codon:yes gene_type:complete